MIIDRAGAFPFFAVLLLLLLLLFVAVQFEQIADTKASSGTGRGALGLGQLHAVKEPVCGFSRSEKKTSVQKGSNKGGGFV